jgi:hypothetical protein
MALGGQCLQTNNRDVEPRVARWYIFKPKIPYLEGLKMDNVGAYILWSF